MKNEIKKPKLSTNSRTLQFLAWFFRPQHWALSVQILIGCFFIVSGKVFHHDEKVVRSRGYIFFTTVKIRVVGRLLFVIQWLLRKNGTFIVTNWTLLFSQPMWSVCYGEGGRRRLILGVTMSIIHDGMGCFRLFPQAVVHRAFISGCFWKTNPEGLSMLVCVRQG